MGEIRHSPAYFQADVLKPWDPTQIQSVPCPHTSNNLIPIKQYRSSHSLNYLKIFVKFSSPTYQLWNTGQVAQSAADCYLSLSLLI